MNTKRYVWLFFNKVLLRLNAKGKREVTFSEMILLLHKFANVYDNRTKKNYIDCMLDNGWIMPKSDDPNIYDILGQNVVTSIYKYRRMTWIINEEAQYDLIDEEAILNAFLKSDEKIQ